MAQTDFLSFLVDETLKLQKNGEARLSSLELKLCDYGLSFLKGEFVPQLQTIRFTAPFGILDIPTNWYVFSAESGLVDHVFDETSDDEHFLEILQKAWDLEFKKILITHADGFCYLVGLRSGDEIHLRDLQNLEEKLNAA